ncbi:MAG: ComF family protein [Deltaproteobacteria bacterium]|nr:MAG: ComF family protein [Deltaproteobacteria bacterium]
MGLLIMEKLPKLEKEKSLIVPVPLTLGKEFRRGFNQSLILAEEAGKVTGIPLSSTLLERKLSFSPSALLPKTEREVAVKGVFRCRTLRTPPPDHIILLDDVATTLATLTECAREIRRRLGKQPSLWCVTVARS